MDVGMAGSGRSDESAPLVRWFLRYARGARRRGRRCEAWRGESHECVGGV